MADSVEMQDIRGLDIQRTLKGFALTEFVFKNALCEISSTSADTIRWYQETSTDLTATSPSAVANISPLSRFPTLEPTWTRNTSYVKKYAAESKISMEDIKGSDIDVLARTLLRLTRAVAKQVDSDIWDVITESQSASNINSVSITNGWDAASGQTPILDILDAIKKIEDNGYSTDTAVLVLSPADKKSLLNWLISSNGSNVPEYASSLAQGGELMRILGLRVITNVNVTADYAVVCVPKVCATFKQHTPLSSALIEDKGVGTTVRVYELGITLLTDPGAVTLLSNTVD